MATKSARKSHRTFQPDRDNSLAKHSLTEKERERERKKNQITTTTLKQHTHA